MKKFLKSFRNYSLMLGLSLILLSCTTRVVTGNLGVPPTGEPTEVPPIGEPTEVPIQLLDVEVDFSFEDCSCSGNFQKAKIILNIKNGEPPFNINDQAPVNERLVTFPVPLASSFPLTITSFDNRVYEAKVEVPLPSSCQPPKNSCGGGGGDGGSCTEKEVQVCEDVVTTIDVCIKWTGNGKKCLEWGRQEKVDTVCHSEVVCE